MILRSLKTGGSERVTLVLENGEEIASTLGVVTELRLSAGKELEEAEKMLRNTKAPIDEIAAQCGFVSANYLIASFYQKYKTTPQAYRKKR